MFYWKEAKESVCVLLPTKEGRVTHCQNAAVSVGWSLGGLGLLAITFKLPVLTKQSEVSQRFYFCNAK